MSESKAPALKKIDAIGVGVALLLTGAAYLIGVEPLLAREAELRDRRAELASTEQAADAAAKALAEMRKQVALAEQRVAENPLRLQPIYRLNTRLAEIAGAGGRHGLLIDQLEPGGATPTEHYVTVPIRVTGRSTYAGAARFLHDLRTSMPDIAVANVEVTGDPRNRKGEAKFTVALLWHASPDAND